MVFGKAGQAALSEELQERLAEGREEIRGLEAKRKETDDSAAAERLDATLARKRVYAGFLEARLQQAEAAPGEDA